MSSDFESLALDGGLGLLQGNVRRGIDKLRGDIDGKQSASYTPGDPSIWDPQPTTIQEAIDRIAAVVAANHGPTIP